MRSHPHSLRIPLVVPALVLTLSGALAAQGSVTIDPGMTRDSVIKRLGQPLSVRSFGSHTYLMYANGCEKSCGMNDLVTLDSGKVVDAIFRAPDRRYSGTSSSPQMIPSSLAPGGMPTDSTGPHHIKVPPGTAVMPERKPASEPKRADEKKVEEKKPAAKKQTVEDKRPTEKQRPVEDKKIEPEKKAEHKVLETKRAPAKTPPTSASAAKAAAPAKSVDTTKKPPVNKKPE